MKEKQLVEYTLEDGTKFLVETDKKESGGLERVALPSGEMVVEAQQSFEKALDKIKPVASAIIAKFRNLNEPADEVEVKFGVKLTADAGAIFASVGGEVNYEITLKWSNNQGQ